MKKKIQAPQNPLFPLIASKVGCKREYVWRILTGPVISNSLLAQKIKEKYKELQAI